MKAVAKVDIVDGKCVVIYSDGSEQELYEVTENNEQIEQNTQDIASNTAAIADLNSRLTSKTIRNGSFNDIDTQGYYYVTSDVTEAPKPGLLWRLRVESYSNAASQYANRNGTAELYFRFVSNNVWSRWYKIETSVA